MWAASCTLSRKKPFDISFGSERIKPPSWRDI